MAWSSAVGEREGTVRLASSARRAAGEREAEKYPPDRPRGGDMCWGKSILVRFVLIID